MSLRRRLLSLDARVIRSVRQPGEDAETYLRRIASRRGPFGMADNYAVQQALREYFAAIDAQR